MKTYKPELDLLPHVNDFVAVMEEDPGGEWVKKEDVPQECKEFKRLLNKVAKVSSYHRHGRPIPVNSLTELANAQVEYEQRNKS